jgi:transposase
VKNDIQNLAKLCGVSMNAACKRSGVSITTPYRWQKKGQSAGAETVKRLRGAVLLISFEAGTLPEEYEHEIRDIQAAEIKTRRQPSEIIRDLKGGLKELERSIVS